MNTQPAPKLNAHACAHVHCLLVYHDASCPGLKTGTEANVEFVSTKFPYAAIQPASNLQQSQKELEGGSTHTRTRVEIYTHT